MALPSELLLNILRFCDLATIREVSCTNKRLHQLVEKNSHRLARRHAKMLWIAENEPAKKYTSRDWISVAVYEKVDARFDRCYQFTVMREREREDDEELSTPEAIRDLIDGLNKADRWKLWEDGMGDVGRRMVVSDTLAVAFAVLDEVLKRISVHRFHMNRPTPEFHSRVLTVLQKHRVPIHKMYFSCIVTDAKHLDDIARTVKLCGVKHLSMKGKNKIPVEQEQHFFDALSQTKKLLYVYGRTKITAGLVLSSAPLGNTVYFLRPEELHPCAECSTSAELRQAAERLAAMHVGVVPDLSCSIMYTF